MMTKDRESEVSKILKEGVELDERKNEITAVVRNLQKEIDRRKRNINEKREDMRETIGKKDKNRRRIDILKETVLKADLNKEKKNADSIKMTRDERLLELEKNRTLYCRHVFGIYPLKIEKVEGDDSDVYCMRNGRLPSRLLSLDHSHLHLTPDPSSLALLVFSSHLVKLLSHILDLPLPCELTVHSLSARGDAFRSQWTKLCLCVSYLSGSLGIEPADPHNSLISLFERLCEECPLRLKSNLPLTRFTQFETSYEPLEPLQTSTEWDTCDDFDTLSASHVYPHHFFK
ncbi:hypothetical protein PFISCL1PPCAC_20713 [Pristionchus fissidentatus]|uniref:Uncharacterized protein n=1 Tax=Pristionchus fissidentatus TaxID=1538716 RepID=A0AAV5WAX6_9BILA|nr:hypothetical protein PFISCL1PPCAC_20713 [Pristionchus fissidentatus]